MENIQFMTSLLTFYLKGEIKHEQNFVKFKTPNTILSLIPLGARNESIPINQISSVETNFKVLGKNLVIGLILAFWGFGKIFGTSFIGGLLWLLIGAGMVINSFQTVLSVGQTSGKEKLVFFLIFEKEKAELAERQINSLIASRLDEIR